MISKHYIIQQIDAAAKLGVKAMFLREKSANILKEIISDATFKKYGRLPVLFSIFYSSCEFVEYGLANFVVRASNGNAVIIVPWGNK